VRHSRQARRRGIEDRLHQFLRAVGHAQAVAPGRPLRLAYTDPPYPGKARLYRDHPDHASEVDHAALIQRLAAYDGWALSTLAQALPAALTGVDTPTAEAEREPQVTGYRLTCGFLVGVAGFEPAASSSRTAQTFE
jgi:hypothetical protein